MEGWPNPWNGFVTKRAAALVEGAVDLHVHVAPSNRHRIADSRELIDQAAIFGMRAVLFKDHDRSTVPDAWHASKQNSAVVAAGAICLNAPVGGLNPAAAEAALQMGARAVFLPTDSARNDTQFWNELGDASVRAHAVQEDQKQYSAQLDALDDTGRLRPEIQAVIDLCGEAGALVCTGHLNSEEISAVVTSCAARGARVCITHAPVFSGAHADLLSSWAAAGAILELVAIFCCGAGRLPESARRSYAQEAALIEAVGASAFALSTDLGQAGNPMPAAGLVEFVDGLLGEGIPEDDIALMTRTNPAWALGLDPVR